MGPSGGVPTDLSLDITASPPAIRSGGNDQIVLTAIASVGIEGSLQVVGLPVSFHVSENGGTFEPELSHTDAQGTAVSTYTSSAESGVFTISVVVEYSGISLSSTIDIDQSPPNLSDALLASSSSRGIISHWNPQAESIIIEIEHLDQLYTVDESGGQPQWFAFYNGGHPNPDGSDQILVYDRWGRDILILNGRGDEILPVTLPNDFNGNVHNVQWCYGGSKVIAVSNSSQNGVRDVAVVDLSDGSGVVHSIPHYVHGISPMPNSFEVVTYSSGAGFYLLDLETGLLSSFGYSWAFEQAQYSIRDDGFCVHPSGDRIIFASQGSLYTMSIADGSTDLVFEGSISVYYPEYLPDGQSVMFCSRRSDEGFNLYILELE